MTTFPGSPRVLKGGIVLLDPDTAAVQRVIALQYNAEKLTRSLQVQGAGDGGDRLEALRLKGPPIETIHLEAEIDAADQLEFPKQNRLTVENGIQPQLSALETIVYPSSTQVQTNDQLASFGTLEIVPTEAPLTLLVWSRTRVLPVRVTEFSIVEEAFDPALNPIRATVTLGMRVLTANDLGPGSKGASLFMAHHRHKEQLAAANGNAALSVLGIGSIR
jgi:hypothetical protein